MSIVNISSENKQEGDTDGQFNIELKKSLQKCIGLQLLNVTVPLSYNIINPDNNQVLFTRGTNKTATLSTGTFSADGLAREMERAMNQMDQTDYPYRRNENQRQLHIDARDSILIVGRRTQTSTAHGLVTHITTNELEAGMNVLWNGGNWLIDSWDSQNDTGTLAKEGVSSVQITGSESGTYLNNGKTYTNNDDNSQAAALMLYYHGFLVFHDEEIDRITIANAGNSFSMRFSEMSRRMCKAIGANRVDAPSVSSSSNANNHKDREWGHYLVLPNLPEPGGPSMLFLRIGGDPLLDQQNSETHMNDRIPIPIDQPHGGVVHYENDSESDVIPFSVPCDVRNLKFRLEYGDDNGIVGGVTENLSGHQVYVRLKFFKMHQANGQKM